MSSTGAIVLAAAVLACVGFALYRARTSGQLRPPLHPPVRPPIPQRMSDNDAFITSDVPNSAFSEIISQQDQQLGGRATLVQFSTAFCQPCRATRQILAEVAELIDGVQLVHVDAEQHLELVRKVDVRRTPTVFLLDADGQIQKKAVGQPRKADVIAAIGELS